MWLPDELQQFMAKMVSDPVQKKEIGERLSESTPVVDKKWPHLNMVGKGGISSGLGSGACGKTVTFQEDVSTSVEQANLVFLSGKVFWICVAPILAQEQTETHRTPLKTHRWEKNEPCNKSF